MNDLKTTHSRQTGPQVIRSTLVGDIQLFTSVVRRHRLLIVGLTVFGAVGGYAASHLKAPTYSATAQISLDPRRVAIAQPVNAQTQRRDEPLIDSGRADTEAETIKSETVIRSVVTSLDLQNNPEFVKPKESTVQVVTDYVDWLLGPYLGHASESVSSQPPATAEEARIAAVMDTVADRLKVERVDKSYVISITYDARDPDLAAAVANRFAQAYIKQQLDALYDTTRQSVQWLKSRTDQMASEVQKAEQAASLYQAEAKIARSDGKLIDEQRLQTLSDQLAAAASQRADAKAKYDRAMQFSENTVGELAVSDSFQNTVITRLRGQYLDLQNKASALAQRYGETHSAVIKLRGDAKALKDSIRQELLRYQESYKNDYDVAVAREQAAQAALDEQFKRTATVSEAQVKLNSLEANAKALRDSYEGFMQRYTEALQRQSFPVSEARVISQAVSPSQPSKPKRPLFAGGGLILGLLAGLGSAFVSELGHRRIRTRAEAEEAAAVECLGYIPKIDPKDRKVRGRRLPGHAMPIDYVAQNPFTVAAETFRTIKTAVNFRSTGRDCPVVGVISCVPDEGKTSIAGNLGFLFADKDRPTLVIDGDIRNPSLSHAMTAVTGTVDASQVIEVAPGVHGVAVPGMPFHFLPAPTNSEPAFAEFNRIAAAGRVDWATTGLEPEVFGRLIAAARTRYANIVVDLPPIVPLADVRAVAPSITSFLLVLAWGRSQAHVVTDALEAIPGIYDTLVGSVINFTEVKSLPRYGEYVSSYYGSKYFPH